MNNTKNDILLFENCCQNKIIFPEVYLLSKEDVCCIDSILVNEECLLQTGSNKITGELFDALCSLDMINLWNIYKHSDINPYPIKVEFVENRKRELDIFYLGKVNISNNFNSYLILTSESEQDEYQIIKNAYLINITDRKVTSITRISCYTCFDGYCNYIYAEMFEKGVFIQKNKEVSSDVILLKEVQPENEKTGIKFMYDRKGYLKTL